MSSESTAVAAAQPRRRAGLARLAREAMRRRLRDLDHGQLSVRDPWGAWMAGSGGGNGVVTVSDPGFYLDVALEGSLGAARAWMDGRWKTEDLTAVLRLMLRNVDLVKRNLNPELEVSTIVCVMYDARTKLSDQVVQEGDLIAEVG